VLVDVVAELNRAVARHPAGEIDPGDRHFLRQVYTSINGLLLAGSRVVGGLWLPIFAWSELASAKNGSPWVSEARHATTARRRKIKRLML